MEGGNGRKKVEDLVKQYSCYVWNTLIFSNLYDSNSL